MEEEIIVQHKHCPVCGRAIPPDEEFCSDECREKMEILAKKKRLFYYAYMGLVVFVMALIVMSVLVSG